jgi:KUP system potassium uptake protein
LEYIHGSLDEFRVIGADDLERMMTWVDASYAVHRDMKSHTGGVVSFGTGALMSKSSKQKLNTKSSTEAELVGASDYLPHAIWAKKFLEGQGYKLKENLFYQDNQSAIRFQKNGRRSCGPNSRHIDIRYFFIKDRLEIEDIEVQYCPTEQMLADFFTKPLQGKLFRQLRAVVMGHEHVNTLKTATTAASQERVGMKDIPKENGNEANVRSTVPVMSKPVTSNGKLTGRKTYTYAEVVKRRPTTGRVRF